MIEECRPGLELPILYEDDIASVQNIQFTSNGYALPVAAFAFLSLMLGDFMF
jgi:hypothetical protein